MTVPSSNQALGLVSEIGDSPLRELSPIREVTRELKRRLLVRLDKGHLVLFEVPLGTGRHRQYADAVSIGTWPSTRYALQGYEFKATRADLKRELINADKAQALMTVVDHFWLVVPSMTLIRGKGREEDLMPRIPEQWGILAHGGQGSLYQQRPPKLLNPVTGVDRKLVVAMLAKAGNAVLETVELVPTGTRYQQRRKRRSRRAA